MNVFGKSLFTTYLLPFEVTSALLVVAVVAAVVLAGDDGHDGRRETPRSASREATELSRRPAPAEIATTHDAGRGTVR